VYVRVEVPTGLLELVEADDFRRFHVQLVGSADVAAAAAALQPVGRLDGDVAWIRLEGLRQLAGERRTPRWEAELARMLEFAKARGWLSADGREIQAHCEWGS
jgi:hypothetical protein